MVALAAHRPLTRSQLVPTGEAAAVADGVQPVPVGRFPAMSWSDVVLLVLAGVGAGLAGSMAGLASLVSFPALLAVGLPPVVANVTNTVALVGSGIGSAIGSRPELAGQGRRILRLVPAVVVGGLAGAALLLLGPASAFEVVVPYLVGASALVLLLQPQLARLRDRARRGAPEPLRRPGARLVLAVGAVAVYGGYFGAGAGVVVLALLVASFPAETPQRLNAVKNVLLGLANGVAAVVFAFSGPVVWAAVLPLAAGFVVGGRTGPVLVRRVPRRVLRTAIGVAGLGLAVELWLQSSR